MPTFNRPSSVRRSPLSAGTPALLAGGLLLLGALTGCGPASQEPSDPGVPAVEPTMIDLLPDQRLDLPVGGVGRLMLEADAGDFVHVVVEQHGIDLAVTLTADGQGEPLSRVDGPIGSFGEEELTAVVPATGSYRIDVIGDDKRAGACLVRLVARRPATEDDHRRVASDHDQRLGWQLHKEKDYEASLVHLREAFAAREHIGFTRGQAESLDALALVFRRLGRDRDVVMALLDRSIALSRQAGDSVHERLRQATMLDRAGVYLRQDRQPARAIGRYLRDAVRLFEEAGDDASLAPALHHLGRAYFDIGDPGQALALYDRALSHGDAGSLLLRDRAATLLALHRSEEAERDARRAAALDAGNEERQRQHFDALIIVASARTQGGDPDGAVELLEPWLPKLAEQEHARWRRSHVRARQTLGAAHRAAGRLDAARAHLGAARDVVGAKPSRSLGIIEMERGHLEVLDGRTARGLALLATAGTLLEEHGSPRDQASVVARTGQALQAVGRLDEAAQHLEQALARVEAIRAATLREDIRLGYFGFRQDYYDIALSIAAARHARDPGTDSATAALALHERRLARELGDRLAASDTGPDSSAVAAESARSTAGIDDQPDEETRLMRALATTASRPDATPEALEDLLADLARARARRPAPATSSTDSARERAILERVRREALGNDTAALVVAVGDDASWRWLVHAERVTLERIDATRAQLQGRAARWIEALRAGSREEAQRTAQRGQSLASALLPSDLPATTTRLVIVVDGVLQQMPWAALPWEGGLVIDRFEVAMQPSLCTLDALRARSDRHPRWPRPSLVLADPVFGPPDPRLGAATRGREGGIGGERGSLADRDLERTARALGIDELSRLAGTADEAATIAALLGSEGRTLALGFDANRSAFERVDRSALGLLHLATHALVDTDRPDLSTLVLARHTADGAPRRGSLYAYEIAGWSLSADLVVLSACDTGRGQTVRGEGVLGLARRFLDAGATRMIASLWRVGDRSTAALMRDIYTGLLRDGLMPAAALRAAQRAARARGEPARAWAGFAFQGDWRRWSVSEDDSRKDGTP